MPACRSTIPRGTADRHLGSPCQRVGVGQGLKAVLFAPARRPTGAWRPDLACLGRLFAPGAYVHDPCPVRVSTASGGFESRPQRSTCCGNNNIVVRSAGAFTGTSDPLKVAARVRIPLGVQIWGASTLIGTTRTPPAAPVELLSDVLDQGRSVAQRGLGERGSSMKRPGIRGGQTRASTGPGCFIPRKTNGSRNSRVRPTRHHPAPSCTNRANGIFTVNSSAGLVQPTRRYSMDAMIRCIAVISSRSSGICGSANPAVRVS